MGALVEKTDITLDELFGDVNLSIARRTLEGLLEHDDSKYIQASQLKEVFHETIIKDIIENINFKTGQQSDTNYLAYLLTWAILGDYYADLKDCSDLENKSKVYFIGLHSAMLQPDNKIPEEELKEILSGTDESIDEQFQEVVNFFRE